jgi:threonine synthase
MMMAIDEQDILPAYAELARSGVHVEPTSALVWAAETGIYRFTPARGLDLNGSWVKI